MIRILIADAHDIVRMGIRYLCGEMGDFVVVAEARCAEEVLDAMAEPEVDLLVIDPEIPGLWQGKGDDMHGLNLVSAIRGHRENLPILVFADNCTAETVRSVACKGGFGFLGKDCDRHTFVTAMRQVAAGKSYVPSDIAIQLMFGKEPEPVALLGKRISAREFQIMKLLAQGIGVNAIAKRLFISNRTVSTHKSRLMHKLNFRSDADLYYFAAENGLVENRI